MKKSVIGICLYSISGLLATTIVGTGSYLLFTKVNKSQDANYEAVVINNDETFAKSIDYTAEIVPGGSCVQEISIKSRLEMLVTYNYNFTAYEKNDYSLLNVKITNSQGLVLEEKLNTLIDNNTLIESTLSAFQEDTLKITYTLSFDYKGNIDSWNFNINFKASGKIVN